MTAVVGPDLASSTGSDGVGPARDGRPDSAVNRRRGRARLAIHVVAVSVLLIVGTLSAAGGGDVFSADEGAVLAQSRLGASEPMDYWAERIDPDGEWFPFDLADRHDRGWFLFAKKPLYVELVGVFERAGGRSLVLVVHGLAVVGAALAAALLSRRIRPGIEIATLWATAIGSPLVVDGSWVIAHAPAAACVGWAAVAACRFAERRSAVDLIGVGGGLVLATLLRTETTLVGLAAVVALMAAAWRGRCSIHARLAASALAGTVGGAVAASWWQGSVQGSSPGLYRIVDDMPWWQARRQAAWNLLLAPEMQGIALGAAFATLVATVSVAVAWSPGCRRHRPAVGVAFMLVAVLALGVRLFVGGFMIPGLLAAFPIGVAALAAGWASRGRIAGHDLAAVLAHIVALTTLAVVATSYASGGTGDWGARYMHLILPLAVPVAVAVLAADRPLRSGVDPHRALLAVAAVLVALGGFVAADRATDNSALAVSAARSEVAAVAGPREPPPIVISTSTAFGRQSWQYASTQRYLTVPPNEMDDALDQVATLMRDPTWIVVIGPGDLGADRIHSARRIGQTWTIGRVLVLPDRTRVPGS